MKLAINRELLLSPLQAVTGVVERRQALPILSNLLVNAEGGTVTVTGTDMEVESLAQISAPVAVSGSVTIPARKLIDICRSLPEGADVTIETKEGKAVVKCGRSRFVLATQPASEFPTMGDTQVFHTFTIASAMLRELINSTQFAMAYQDIRYYLNGLLLEIGENRIRTVATDGHRLAMSDAQYETGVKETVQLIVPRKGVGELLRLLGDAEEDAVLQLSHNYLRVTLDQRTITTKLIDGKFPDYIRVLPVKGDKVVVADRETMRQGLARTSILSNEKFRGVRLTLGDNVIKALAHNAEHEEAEEEIEVTYSGPEIEIGFNVVYLLDVLGVIKSGNVQLEFSSSEKSCLIQPVGEASSKYVVMPMRL